MVAVCKECGAATEWDDDAGSAICLRCGTLADTSQTVLQSDYTFQGPTSFPSGNQPYSHPVLRNGRTRVLEGQEKEARNRRNSIAMFDFIKSLTMIMNCASLAERVNTLFAQCMTRGTFKWGRKGKLVAGACLSIALRETHQPLSVGEIAYILEEKQPVLARLVAQLLALLELNLPSDDAVSHLNALHSYLNSEIQSFAGDHKLSINLLTLLKGIFMPNVIETCHSLHATLVHTSAAVLGLPSPATASAILIISLESEARLIFPNLAEIATFLGARCNAGEEIIKKRYTLIQTHIQTLLSDLPWNKADGKSVRTSKASKRLTVARGLKDVIRFYDDQWKEKVDRSGRPALILEDDGDDDNLESIPAPSLKRQFSGTKDRVPRKRRKTTYSEAAQFLLNPLLAPLPACSDNLPLTSYILSAPSHQLLSSKAPTRLQLLSVERGGSEQENIADDELFEENELSSIIRSNEEAILLQSLWDQSDGDSSDSEQATGTARKGQKISRPPASSWGNEAKRINLEAFADFMADEKDEWPVHTFESAEEKDGDEDNLVRLGLSMFGTTLSYEGDPVVEG